MEAFIGLVHVKDTSSLSLKKAIVNVAHRSLTLDYVRGQCYDGARNMRGELGDLKTLIRQESRSDHSVHCFAHQLQLTLVVVSKKCVQIQELVLLTSNILNVLGASFKCVDEFRESQKEKLQEALDMGELEMGRGLNQELGLIKVGDTRWESHYKSFGNFISNFAFIVDILDSLVENASTSEEKASALGFLRSYQTFETIFLLHLMTDVLGIINDLNMSLQKKEQDIANAMILVQVAKRILQALRDNEFDPILKKNLQKLNDHFNEVTSDLINGVACLKPIDTFSSFDIQKILVMAKLYPNNFDEFNMGVLENQIVNYIIDVRDIDKRFFNLDELGKLSRKLVETKKHLTYPLVFLLVKFALLLPVATASVERAFPAMKYIKNDLQNRMDDEFLDGCIVPYVEKRVFKNISNECIIEIFQGMKRRRMHL
ncbi:zinc finger MYM-type protein 1-like [Capsicum annuum]